MTCTSSSFDTHPSGLRTVLHFACPAALTCDQWTCDSLVLGRLEGRALEARIAKWHLHRRNQERIRNPWCSHGMGKAPPSSRGGRGIFSSHVRTVLCCTVNGCDRMSTPFSLSLRLSAVVSGAAHGPGPSPHHVDFEGLTTGKRPLDEIQNITDTAKQESAAISHMPCRMAPAGAAPPTPSVDESPRVPSQINRHNTCWPAHDRSYSYYTVQYIDRPT